MDNIEKIKKLKEEKNAIILAHYYVDEEVQRLLIILEIHFILLKLQVKQKLIVLFLRVLNLWGKVPKS